MSKIDEVIELLKKARLNIPDGITKAQDAICAALDFLEAAKAEQAEPGELPKSETHTEIIQARLIVKDGVMTAKLEGYVVMPTPTWEKVCAETERLTAELKAKEEEIKTLRNRIVNVEDDANYYHAIFDGSWPQAKEILRATLKKVEALAKKE